MNLSFCIGLYFFMLHAAIIAKYGIDDHPTKPWTVTFIAMGSLAAGILWCWIGERAAAKYRH